MPASGVYARADGCSRKRPAGWGETQCVSWSGRSGQQREKGAVSAIAGSRCFRPRLQVTGFISRGTTASPVLLTTINAKYELAQPSNIAFPRDPTSLDGQISARSHQPRSHNSTEPSPCMRLTLSFRRHAGPLVSIRTPRSGLRALPCPCSCRHAAVARFERVPRSSFAILRLPSHPLSRRSRGRICSPCDSKVARERATCWSSASGGQTPSCGNQVNGNLLSAPENKYQRERD